MKYWFFDGNDVAGPFTRKELTANKSFSEMSLICPEHFSDDQDHWQVAATFAEFQSFFGQRETEEAITSTFEQEMNTLLQERSPLLFDETPSDGPGLQIPKKPAKPGPIEDYFNRVKGEDLGDILGIPNPNENSDMDLAHALEKQLEKTDSTRREKKEPTPDEQTVLELEQAAATHHVATVTEVFGPQPQEPKPLKNEPAPSMPMVEPATMPVLAQDSNLLQAARAAAQPAPEPEPIQPTDPQPEQHLPEQPVEMIPDPALLRAEKIEVNSVRARLKQTQEMKDFLHETKNAHLNRQTDTHRRILVMLLAVLAIVAGLLVTLHLHTPQKTASFTVVQTPAAELLEEVPPAPKEEAPVPQAPPPSQEQQALTIVQNYTLNNKRGTLANYLNRIYKTQLAQGYIGAWEAEPLYKNTYIVKYRLTKTRKEPIIYVFQADVAQGKLTGALNNISLDLVGKIN